MKFSGINYVEILENRVEAIKNYIKENDTGEGIQLRRKDILGLVGIKEGDSAKTLMKALEECSNINIIKEKNQSRYFYIYDESDMDKPSDSKMIIHNVRRIGENRYSTTMNGKELQRYWNGGTGVITYNPIIQRGEKIIIKKDGSQETVPVFNANNVKKIAVLIIKGNYHTDTIVINIMADGRDKIRLEDDTLYIINGEVNILDGQHRLRALDLVKKIIDESNIETPLDLASVEFPVIIENMALADAQETFYQYSQGLKVSSTRAEYFNNKNYENLIVKDLLKNSDLKNRVEVVRNTINKKDVNNIVTFATLVNSVRMVFNSIQTEGQAKKIADFLCKFYTKLIDMVPELHDYDKRTASKEYSLIGENIAFYGYTAVASILYTIDNWEDAMTKLLELDFRKDAKAWHNKIIRKGRKEGFSITNNMDGRAYFINTIKIQFLKLLEQSKSVENSEEKAG